METSIRKEIARAITHQCNCTFDPGFIRPGKFSCRNTQGNQVTYRSTLVGGSVHTASNLLQFIKEWVQSAPALCTELFILDVDPNCPAQIQSLTDPECAPSSAIPIAANKTTNSTIIQCLSSCVSSI